MFSARHIYQFCAWEYISVVSSQTDRFHCHATKNKIEAAQWNKPKTWNFADASPEWPKATSFLGGSGGMLPRKFFEINMRWDAIWCILRHNFEKCCSSILFYFLVVITFWQCQTELRYLLTWTEELPDTSNSTNIYTYSLTCYYVNKINKLNNGTFPFLTNARNYCKILDNCKPVNKNWPR